jgi:cellulose synthase/poly-beta-1,6-N-acetylglucosamine synthase-like glycosyltransferase
MGFANGQTLFEALLPAGLIGLIAFAVFPWLNRNSETSRTITITICLFLMWRYLTWRIVHTLPPIDFTIEFATGLAFLIVELLCSTGATISMIILTRTRCRTPEAHSNLLWLNALPAKPLVDVLICTYNEEEEILERTIVGAQALEYDNFRVWVCDDGRRPWLETLCARLKCNYLTRPDNAHAKAGNINNAVKHLSALPERPQFIAILDADFVVQPQFLRRTVALAKSPNIGVVQTPQTFFNSDPIQANLGISHLWPDEQRYFFDVLMPSKDAWGAAFCCGTSSLIRFDPLVKIGGFPTDSVTEDYLLTLRLKERGYDTIYLSEVLSLGLAPEGLKEYIVQRSRWCLGFMQIVRGRSGPFCLHNRLSLFSRIMLLETLLHWSMTFTFRLMCLLIPVLYLLCDVQAVHAHPLECVSYVAPYLVMMTAFNAWLTGGRALPILSEVNQLLAATPILHSAIIGLCRPAGHKFKVTAKGGDRTASFIQWPVLRIILGYFGVTALAILWAYIVDDSRPLADATAISLFWSWYNIIVLTIAGFIAIEAAQRRRTIRFTAHDRFEVTVGQEKRLFDAADISIGGIAFWGQCPSTMNGGVTVSVGRMPVPGSVVRIQPNSFGIRFDHDDATRAQLIRHVFSGRYNPQVEHVNPTTVCVGILRRLWS